MKTVFKSIIVAFMILSVSCIEVAVGTAVVAGGTFIAKQGYVEAHADRSYDSCWQQMEKYTREVGATTYHSQNEGVIKVDFEGGGSGTFKIKKTTNRATLVSLKCYRYGFPNNTLAEAHFSALMEMLQ